MPDDLTQAPSPFHSGEQQVQERLGVRDRIESFARKVVRAHMPDEHREFYGSLPFVLLGTVDRDGRPWASLLAGPPSFMSSPDSRTLRIAAPVLPGDPLHDTLREGADVGLLGIEPATRRRNRLTGRIDAIGPDGFSIAVRQTFGNCPQYIQAREVTAAPAPRAMTGGPSPIRSDRFDERARALIEGADTLFIATAYTDEPGDWSQGADISHRGGKPGFVKIEDERTLIFPDFSGNNHFNTVGNIVLNPRAGLLFVDFASDDLLYATGGAEIVWEGEELRAFAGAERLIRFRADSMIRVPGSLPLRFEFRDYSPMLQHTGSWTAAAERIASDRERNRYLDYEIAGIQRESDSITSFYLRRADGKALPQHEPGQFLPISLTIPGHDGPVRRTYTLSDAPGPPHYRLSIKREGGSAVASNHLHEVAQRGYRLRAMAPRGKFTLDRSSERPVALISAGVGITPMIAMTNFIVNEGLRTRMFRRTHFIHGAQSGREMAFSSHIRELASQHDTLRTHIRFSRPAPEDRIGETHDSEGHVDIELLKLVLPFDDHDFYLCGPPPFMQSLHDGLIGLGVRESRIRYEAFGPATVLRHGALPVQSGPGKPVAGPVAVSFATSGVEAEWTPDKGTLLDLAESVGLAPAHSCRSGVCGTCATRVRCGGVDYLDEPTAPRGEDEVLICCSTPRSGSGEASCGAQHGIVLDL